MKEFWRILKLIFAWIIGSAGVIIGLIAIFETDTWIQRIFTGFFILISLYIIPKINNWLRFGIRPKFVAIAFLASFLGMVLTDSMKTNSKSDVVESDSVAQHYVTASKLNVRKGMGTNYEVIYQLDKGDRVDIIAESGDWTEIKTTQGQGFVSRKYISIEKPKDSDTSDWATYIIVGGFILYALFSKKGSSSSGGSSKPRSTPISRPTSKPEAPTHICKYCGTKNKDMWQLTVGTCHDSPTKKHQPFEGGIRHEYICKYCGTKNKDLWQLTRGTCHDSPTKKHQPFEGGVQSEYLCKYCGTKNRDLWQLTRGTCHKSPNNKHQPHY